MGHDILRDGLVLLATIDPIGTVLVFAAVSGGLEVRERRRLARRAIVIAGSALLGFLVLGEFALEAMHVSLPAFQLAGGLFLFLFGAQMTLTDFTGHASLQAEGGRDPAVFPLAIPAIASPGALLAVVVLTDNARYTIGSQALTVAALLVILLVTYLGMRWADLLIRIMGRNGGAALIRILGMILAALAVQLGIEALIQLGVVHVATT